MPMLIRLTLLTFVPYWNRIGGVMVSVLDSSVVDHCTKH